MPTSSVAQKSSKQAVLDQVLTIQLAVAWAGEGGEEPRLGWWRTDLVSEFGGQDLFRRLLPHTWPWAVLEAAREAARRTDAQIRSRHHDPDHLLSLFHFGFAVDEPLDERLADLKRAGTPPAEALPDLGVLIGSWSAQAFADWVAGLEHAETTAAPVGRQLKGPMPDRIELVAQKLAHALLPFPDSYPLPHYRRTP